MRKYQLQSAGFSIYEIIAVVIILSVLLSLIVPNFTLMVRRGENQEAEQLLRAVWMAQQDYKIENGSFAPNVSNLDLDIAAPQNFIIYPQQQNIICGGNTVNSLAHMHKVQNGIFIMKLFSLMTGKYPVFHAGEYVRKWDMTHFKITVDNSIKGVYTPN